jgi:hypothetical protein
MEDSILLTNVLVEYSQIVFQIAEICRIELKPVSDSLENLINDDHYYHDCLRNTPAYEAGLIIGRRDLANEILALLDVKK